MRSRRPDIVIVQFGINDSWIDIDLGSTTPRLTRAEFRAPHPELLNTTEERGIDRLLEQYAVLLAGDGIHSNQAGR